MLRPPNHAWLDSGPKPQASTPVPVPVLESKVKLPPISTKKVLVSLDHKKQSCAEKSHFCNLDLLPQEEYDSRREPTDRREYFYFRILIKRNIHKYGPIQKIIVWDIDDTLRKSAESRESKEPVLNFPIRTRQVLRMKGLEDGVLHICATARRAFQDVPGQPRSAGNILRMLGDFFDRLYFSNGRSKTGILEKLAEEFNLSPEDVVLVDDLLTQCEPARKAKFTAIQVQPGTKEHLNQVHAILKTVQPKKIIISKSFPLKAADPSREQALPRSTFAHLKAVHSSHWLPSR